MAWCKSQAQKVPKRFSIRLRRVLVVALVCSALSAIVVFQVIDDHDRAQAHKVSMPSNVPPEVVVIALATACALVGFLLYEFLPLIQCCLRVGNQVAPATAGEEPQVQKESEKQVAKKEYIFVDFNAW